MGTNNSEVTTNKTFEGIFENALTEFDLFKSNSEDFNIIDTLEQLLVKQPFFQISSTEINKTNFLEMRAVGVNLDFVCRLRVKGSNEIEMSSFADPGEGNWDSIQPAREVGSLFEIKLDTTEFESNFISYLKDSYVEYLKL